MVPTTMFLKFLVCLCLVQKISGDLLTNNNIEALLKIQLRNDYLLEQFLNEEFSYKGIEDLLRPFTDLPFRDIHADSFFRTGILPVKHLREYIGGKNISRLLGALDLKPWVSLEFIKDELAKCSVQYNYISMSKQEFSYDKKIYGTMNMVKFSCRHAFNDVIVYGVGMQRFRFRFKDVLLNKLQKYWASTSRSITIRDMQKLINYFSARFAQSMSDYYDKEIKKLTAITNEIEEEEQELGFTLEPEDLEAYSTTFGPETTEEPTTTTEKPKKRTKKRKHKSKKIKPRSKPTTTTTTTTTESPIEMSAVYPYGETTLPEEDDLYTTEAPWPETTEEPSAGVEEDSKPAAKPKDTETMEIADVDEHEPLNFVARYPYVASRKGCILMNPKSNHTVSCDNLVSLDQDVKQKLDDMFPFEDIEELPYMTKDHTFKIVSIPITIRVMLANPVKIPDILDIFQHDMSTESRDVMENCQDEFCEEPDEVVELHDHPEEEDQVKHYRREKVDIKRFFQDRALRYNMNVNSSLLVYATSSPRLAIDTSTKRKYHKLKAATASSELGQEVYALWTNLLESQVAENFAIHHRPAMQDK